METVTKYMAEGVEKKGGGRKRRRRLWKRKLGGGECNEELRGVCGQGKRKEE